MSPDPKSNSFTTMPSPTVLVIAPTRRLRRPLMRDSLNRVFETTSQGSGDRQPPPTGAPRPFASGDPCRYGTRLRWRAGEWARRAHLRSCERPEIAVVGVAIAPGIAQPFDARCRHAIDRHATGPAFPRASANVRRSRHARDHGRQSAAPPPLASAPARSPRVPICISSSTNVRAPLLP